MASEIFDSWTFFSYFLEFGIVFVVLLSVQLILYSKVGHKISRTIGLAASWIPKDKWKIFYIPACIGLSLLCASSLLFLLLWGGFAAAQVSPSLAGFVVIFLGLSYLCILLGFLQWRAAAFRISIVPLVLMISAFLLYFVYQLCFVFLVKPFSFQAVSATFLTYNMMFTIALIYINLMGDRKSADSVMAYPVIVAPASLPSSQAGKAPDPLIASKVPKALQFLDGVLKFRMLISIILYVMSVLLLICYALLVQFLAESEGASIGWVSLGTVLVIDALVVLMYRSNVLASPLFVMLMCAGARTAIVAFGIKWWFLSQSVIYFSFATLLGHCIIERYVPMASEEKEKQKQILASIDVALNTPRPASGINRKSPMEVVDVFLKNHVFLLCLYTLIFLVPLILVAADAVWAPAVRLVDGEHSQYIFGLSGIFLSFFFVLVQAAFRVWKMDSKPKVGLDGKPIPSPYLSRFRRFGVLAFTSYLFAVSCGVFLYVLTKSVIVISSCMCAPLTAILLFLIAKGWQDNDYDLFQPASMRPEIFPPTIWGPVISLFSRCRPPQTAAVVPANLPSSGPDPNDPNTATPTAGGSNGGGVPAAPPTAGPSPRTTNMFICFFRRGLTPKDYAMTGGIVLFGLVLLAWALAISLTFGSAPWLGWTIACSIITLVTCGFGVWEWFATLELAFTIFINLGVSAGTWVSYCIAMFVNVLGAKATNASLALLLAFLLFPTIVLMGTALYKWKDDKWRPSLFVIINLSTSLALMLAFIITVCAVSSLVAGLALLIAFIFLLTAIGTIAAWYINGRYLAPKHLTMAGAALAGILAISVIAAVSLSMFFLGFSLLTLSCAFCLGAYWLRFLLTSTDGSVIYSDHVFPVYTYDPKKDTLTSAWTKVASGYGCMLLLLLWASLAHIFIDRPVYGLGFSSLALLAIFVYTLDNQMRSAFLFGKLAVYISKETVGNLRAKALSAQLGGDEDVEAQMMDGTNVGGTTPSAPLVPATTEDLSKQIQDMSEQIRSLEYSLLKPGALPETIYDTSIELAALDAKIYTLYKEQKMFEAHFKFLLIFAAYLQKKNEELEIADMLRAKGIQGVTPAIVSEWDLERKEQLAEELERWRTQKAREAQEREQKRKEDEEAHKRRLEEEKRKREEERRHKEEEERQKENDSNAEAERKRHEEEERKRQEEARRLKREEEEKKRRQDEAERERARKEQEDRDRQRLEELKRQAEAASEEERKRKEKEHEELERKMKEKQEDDRRLKEQAEQERKEREERQRLEELEHQRLEQERLERERREREQREKEEEGKKPKPKPIGPKVRTVTTDLSDEERRRKQREEQERIAKQIEAEANGENVNVDPKKKKEDPKNPVAPSPPTPAVGGSGSGDDDEKLMREIEEEKKRSAEERKRKEEEEERRRVAAAAAAAGPSDEEALAAMRKEVNAIIERCKKTNIKYSDPEFGATPSSLGSGVASRAQKWCRPTDFIEGAPVLFNDSCSASDIAQGALGDCWFLSAMSVLAIHEDRLKKVFVTPEVNEQGVYCVRFFRDGKWKPVIVDDRFPCGASSGPVFATSKQENELWVMLLEKAYAKLHGSFEAIEGGFVQIALVDMTGGMGSSINLESDEAKTDAISGSLWTTMLENKDAGHMMGAGSPAGSDTDISAEGIVQGHAYAITDVQEVDGNKLVRLRNPWGQTEWKGDWSDSSSLWTKRMKAKLNYSNTDDGEFWMCFEDFTRYYSNLYVCRLFEGSWKRQSLQSEWAGETAGGCFNYPTAPKNPQFALTITRPTKVFISLAQEETRGSGRDYIHVGMVLFNCGGKRALKQLKSTIVTRTPSYIDMREVTIEITLDPLPNAYTIFASSFEPKKETKFALTVYSDNDVKLEAL